MFKLDLNKDYTKKSSPSIKVVTVKVKKKSTEPPKVVKKEPVALASKAEGGEISDRKALLLDAIEKEAKEVRYARSQEHLPYRDMVEIIPGGYRLKASREEFIDRYCLVENHTKKLQQLHLRKKHVELHGKDKEASHVSQSKINDLRYQRKRLSDNIYKWNKNLEKANITGNTTKIRNAEEKLQQYELEVIDIEFQLKQLKDV